MRRVKLGRGNFDYYDDDDDDEYPPLILLDVNNPTSSSSSHAPFNWEEGRRKKKKKRSVDYDGSDYDNFDPRLPLSVEPPEPVLSSFEHREIGWMCGEPMPDYAHVVFQSAR